MHGPGLQQLQGTSPVPRQLPATGHTKRVNEDFHMDAAAWSRLGETNTCTGEGEANLRTLRCNL